MWTEMCIRDSTGCVFLGFGIALEVHPDVLILPGEGLVRAITRRFHLQFGRVKSTFDLTLVGLAALVSVLATGKVLGIREGTVVAALIVGPISHFFLRRIAAFARGENPLPEPVVRAIEESGDSEADVT